MPRIIKRDLQIAWDGTNYIDETARLISASGTMRLTPPGESITSGGGIVDSCSLTLQNADGRYSPLNTGGALYASMQAGGAYHRPVYLRVSVDDGANYHNVFKGVIKIPVESGPSASDIATVTIECRSVEEKILSARFSTLRSAFAGYHDDGKTEEEVIALWLTAVGLVDGTDFVSQAYSISPGGTATLDPGFFVIPWTWLDDESALADAWGLAAACGGRLYSTPDGLFRYENAAHWLRSPHTTSQATLTGASAASFQPWYNDKELYDAVLVEVSERAVLDSDEIWKADDVVTVPAASTITYTAKMRQPAYAISGLEYTAITSGGVDITSSVTITRTDYAQRSILSIVNAHTNQAANLVVLKLIGQAVSGRPGAEITETSVASFWTGRSGRERTIRGNPYIQTQGQGAFVAEFLRDRSELPRLFWRIEGVPGLPERRLGDRLTLNEPQIMSAARAVFVTAIDWRLGQSGFGQKFEAVDAADLYPWQTSYFILGSSLLKAANSDHVFY